MSMDLVAPSFLRAMAEDLLFGRVSTHQGSDYLCRAADEIERLRAIPTPEGRGGEDALRSSEWLRAYAQSSFTTIEEADRLHTAASEIDRLSALLSSPRVEEEVIEAEYLRLEAQLWDDGDPARLLIEGAADTIERLTRERGVARVEEVRREALEEAAKVAETFAGRLATLQATKYPHVQIGSHKVTCAAIAAEIRALSPPVG